MKHAMRCYSGSSRSPPLIKNAVSATKTGLNFDFDHDPSWRQMLRDQGQDESDPGAVINRFNMAWVKKKTCPGMTKRAPALFCVLRSIDLSSADPGCQLEVRDDPVGPSCGVVIARDWLGFGWCLYSCVKVGTLRKSPTGVR